MSKRISVEERLPEIGQVVVLWDEQGGQIGFREFVGDEWMWAVAMSVPWWNDDHWETDTSDDSEDLHPTHWSEMPGLEEQND